jgi:hypothetical protein
MDSYGLGGGGGCVGCGLGVGIGRLGVVVAVGVGGHMAAGVGPYLPPVFNENEVLSPPQTSISLAVHTAV